jgi:putative ABC transport system permease protein
MTQDFLYALRALRKKPLFSAIAILTLALGIGANAAIFSVVNGVLLQPLPYPEPDRLMFLWTYNPRQGFDKDVGTYPNYEDWRRQSTSFAQMAAYSGAGFTLTGAGDPVQLRGAFVTTNFFETLGVVPTLGRLFGPTHGTAGGARAVILSHGLWRSRFGGDSGIVGRTVLLDGRPHEVLGVMPPQFAHPENAVLWAPLAPTERFAELLQGRGSYWLTIVGRLKPAISRAAAQSEMDVIAAALERQYPVNAGIGVRLVPMHEEIVGDVRLPLLILLGAVSFVLLIACANVANLLLTRAAARRQELAIRVALGAGRARIIRQLLTESFVLAVGGGIAGLALAAWGIAALQSLAPANVPRLDAIGVDAAVIAYTSLAVLATTMLFGLAPALQHANTPTGESLKEGGRSGGDGARARRMRAAVATVQVAVALVLLIGAGLLVRSFIAMSQVRLGFDPTNVLALQLDLPDARYPTGAQVAAFFDEVAARVRSLPGVESTGLSSSILLPALPASATLSVEGRPPANRNEPNIPVPYDSFTADAFTTLRIPLVQGRLFTDQDGPSSLPVVVVNESFVRRFFPGGDALGKRVTFGSPQNPQATWSTIIGVVADTRRGGLERAPWAEVYYPVRQVPDSRMFVLVRTTGDPLALARAAQAEVWAVDREQPVTSVRTVDTMLTAAQANRRFTAYLLGLFSIVALTLAAIGIYGVMAYATAQRTREIGIRMALGASRAVVLRMVLVEGLAIAGVGLAAGLTAAAILTRYMSTLLFGIGTRDPITFILLPLGLLAIVAMATLIPAARAARVSPMTALRG